MGQPPQHGTPPHGTASTQWACDWPRYAPRAPRPSQLAAAAANTAPQPQRRMLQEGLHLAQRRPAARAAPRDDGGAGEDGPAPEPAGARAPSRASPPP